MILDSTVLERVPLGRRRAIAWIGTGLAAAGTQVWFAEFASASIAPCCCSPECAACSPFSGCPGCTPRYDAWDDTCWTVCDAGELYACCDYYQNGNPCICRTFQGGC